MGTHTNIYPNLSDAQKEQIHRRYPAGNPEDFTYSINDAGNIQDRKPNPTPIVKNPVLYNHNPRTLADETRNEIIRQSAPEMVEALIQAESALFYAEKETIPGSIYTLQDIQNARARIRLILESFAQGIPARL